MSSRTYSSTFPSAPRRGDTTHRKSQPHRRRRPLATAKTSPHDQHQTWNWWQTSHLPLQTIAHAPPTPSGGCASHVTKPGLFDRRDVHRPTQSSKTAHDIASSTSSASRRRSVTRSWARRSAAGVNPLSATSMPCSAPQSSIIPPKLSTSLTSMRRPRCFASTIIRRRRSSGHRASMSTSICRRTLLIVPSIRTFGETVVSMSAFSASMAATTRSYMRQSG